MYLKSLLIKNFRTHRNTTLHLSKGINVIVGDSNNGKTNVLRALDWLRLNRPKGGRIRSDFAKDDESTLVKAVFEGRRGVDEYVSYKKGKRGEAVYSIGDSKKGEINSFRKFGMSVPEDISALINLDAINYQDQLNPHFLITSSPGEVAREINRVTNLERVDSWIKALTKKVNGLNKEVSVYKKQIDDKTKELESFPNIDELESRVEKLEGMEKDIAVLNSEILELESLIEDLQEITKTLDSFSRLAQEEKDIVRAITLGGEIKKVNEDVEYLEELIEGYHQSIAIIRGSNRDIEKAEVIIGKMSVLANDIAATDLNIQRLENYIGEIESLDKVIEEIDVEINKEQKALYKALEEMRVCPICQTSLTKEKIKAIYYA